MYKSRDGAVYVGISQPGRRRSMVGFDTTVICIGFQGWKGKDARMTVAWRFKVILYDHDEHISSV